MKQPPVDTVGLLAEHGLRVTAQRTVVLEGMVAEPNDVTAQALFERLRLHHPRLGLATVYRTLNALADAGVLDRLSHHADAACFRFCAPGHHHHLTCRECHAVVEVHDCDLADWAQHAGRRHGFRAIKHSVELEGTCDACHQREISGIRDPEAAHRDAGP